MKFVRCLYKRGGVDSSSSIFLTRTHTYTHANTHKYGSKNEHSTIMYPCMCVTGINKYYSLPLPILKKSLRKENFGIYVYDTREMFLPFPKALTPAKTRDSLNLIFRAMHKM